MQAAVTPTLSKDNSVKKFTKTLEESIEAAIARCSVLTREDVEHFVAHGYVVVKNAFSKELAASNCESAWRELESEHEINRNDPDSWSRRKPGKWGPVGYIRTKGSGTRISLKNQEPRAFYAQADLIGGTERLPNDGEDLLWGDSAIANLGIEGDPRWQPPSPQQPGWHKDGWHFRHFLNSPEQGLLTVPLYSDILPKSGGTFVAADSMVPVANLLKSIPAGLHPDSVQGAGYLIPGLVEQCNEFIELTGEAGDMVLLHPFMLHRVSINPSTRPRFIANMALVLKEKMCLDRRQDGSYSLVELATLNALGVTHLDDESTRDMKGFKPFPFRDETEREREHEALHLEMRELAERGISTPEWAETCGYMSNRVYTTNT